jgi:hypothetical protein
MRRITVAVLAAVVSVAWLALFVAGEMQLDPGVLERSGMPLVGRWVRVLLAVAGALPWAVGAVLLAARRPRLGTAVLVTAAVLLVPALAPVLRTAQVVVTGSGAETSADTVMILGGAVLWLVSVLTGVVAFVLRPRGGWREGATGPRHGFTAAATLAWLGTLFASTAYAPPGAPRRFVELPAGADGIAAIATFGLPLVAAAVLWAAPRLRPAVGAAVLLTYVVPELVTVVVSVQEVRTVPDVIFTPAGVCAPIGLLALLGFAIAWLRAARDQHPGPSSSDDRPLA